MKLIQLLKEHILQEYSDKLINQMVALYKSQTEESEDQIKANIKRFEQLTNSIAKKLADKNPVLDKIMPDELKVNNKFRDITQYKQYELLTNVIKASDSKPIDVYKQAIEMYKKRDRYANAQIIGNYVARFKQNLNALIEKVNDKDPEALNSIGKQLLQKDAYKNIMNWHSFHDLELMLDTLFPIETEGGGENDAYVQADKIYDKNNVEVFKGDEENKCIYYTKKYLNSYGWCIGNTMYSSYRYMQSNADLNRMFYFVFDRTLDRSDKYHAVVLHAFAGGGYTRTTAVNGDETQPVKWDKLGELFSNTPSGAALWNKIKHLEHLFKFIEPNRDEQRRIGFRGQRKTLEQFALMDNEDKKDWLRANATDNNIVNSDIVKSIPAEGDVSRNELINYDRMFNFDELKDSKQLLRRYAEYRFSRYPNEKLPILFLPYLKDESKSRYYNKFKEKEITFEYALKFFGEEITKEYVNEQIQDFKFVPETAISYIDDPKQKALYTIIHKLYQNWKYDPSTNLSDKELEKMNQMPEARIDPIVFTYPLWKGLPIQERKIIMAFIKKYGNESAEKYEFIKYAMPYLVILPEGEFVLVPLELGESWEHNNWVLADVEGNVYKHVDGIKTEIKDANLQSGFLPDPLADSRILTKDDIKFVFSSNKKINEIKYSLSNYKDILNY